MLAASGEAAYISEPLNVLHRAGVMHVPVQHWYTYICQDNETQFLDALDDTLSFRYHLATEMLSLRSRKDLMRMGRDWSIFARGRLLGQRPLLKDPFAVFSIPWFAERLGCKVVVTVRHPLAFASSLKRLGWSFQIEDLLAQPLLMRDWLEPFRDDMQAVHRDDVIGQAGLLWKMIYYVVSVVRQRYPQTIVVLHEDLSLEPLEGYRNLYMALELNFSEQAQQRILQASSAENPKELAARSVHATHLDSRANLQNWKHRLQTEDLARIQQMTEGVVEQYYPDYAWNE